ncbi:MAG: hypothetical protein Q9173_003220, partial [Seirophora scorigena]
MPSTPLPIQRSQQHLTESQADNHYASIHSKYSPEIYAIHRRDVPVSGAPDLYSLGHWPNVGNPKSSLGFTMSSLNSVVPNGGLNAREMATNPDTDSMHRPSALDEKSESYSSGSYGTGEVLPQELPPLQAHSALDEYDQMRPLSGDLLGSFDLVAPPVEAHQPFSLEKRTEQLFSREHLQVVFSNPTLLLRFTAFLSTHRPDSVPLLIHYLDALKALRAIRYSNAVAEALSPIRGHEFTTSPIAATINLALDNRAAQAFDALVDHDLPAYITHIRGQIRYHIGAQVDVSGLVKDCTDLESFQQLVINKTERQSQQANDTEAGQKKDEFQELSEMLNMGELETVRRFGGKMHRESYEEEEDISRNGAPHRPRLLLKETTGDFGFLSTVGSRASGKLSGIFQHYLLIRPYPSLRILFASPTLRVPGILQSPFINKIGGSSRVRDELTSALAEGRGVTAKVRWVTRADEEGRNRWIHCTPLVGSNGLIGVWMVVLVDDDQGLSRRWKQAPPVDPHRGRVYGSSRNGRERSGLLDEYTIGKDSGFEDTMMGTPVSIHHPTLWQYEHLKTDQELAPERSMTTGLLAGSPEPASNYSRIVVIPSMQEDDTRWIRKQLPEMDVSITIANNPAAPKHAPKNKGHEVMIYLTYLIDNYDRLPDIVLFMHSHRWTHHNNHLLGFDASQMIRALNNAHVVREGYVNMRCHWSPGCPEWLRTNTGQDTLGKQEESVLER